LSLVFVFISDSVVLYKPTMTATHYIVSRIPTLFKVPGTSWKALNPLPALRALSRSDWNYFSMGYFAWTIDAFDFFCVSACAPALAKAFDRSIHDITWGITLVLMTRECSSTQSCTVFLRQLLCNKRY
jgi:hypothetical protein